MKLDLNGKWQFKSSRDASFFDAVVPGTNFLDLIRLDRMKNPPCGRLARKHAR